MVRVLLATCLQLATALSFVIPPNADIFARPLIPSSYVPETEQVALEYEDDSSVNLPVVIWHGLGDSSDADGLKDVAEVISEVHPGTYVHIISLADASGSDDRTQSWFGNVNDQVDLVCHQLANDPILSTAPAINAIGFSQGGVFIRGYIERCGHWAPKVKNLITFGSPHNGLAEFRKCTGWTDFLCNAANLLLGSGLVWSDYIQHKVVPAQYYRPTGDYENYVEHSNFLADVNNEKKQKNQTYADNLAELEKFVMIIFEDDTVVVPKTSGWFTNFDVANNITTPLRERKLYKEDWIGLKKLDEKGALVFEKVPGQHMQLNEKDLVRLFKTYLAPVDLNEYEMMY